MKHKTNRRIEAALVVCGLIFVFRAAAADGPDDLVRVAWEASPSLAATEARIEAVSEAVPQARAWSDPVLGVEYSNAPVDSFALGEHPMTGVQFRIQQTFPFPGTTRRKVEAAAADAETERLALAERKNELRGMIQTAYWRLARVRNLESITRRHIVEVKRLIDSVASRYEVGKAGQHDLLRLKVLRARLEDRLGDFERAQKEQTATINALLSRPADVPVRTPEPVEAVAPEQDAGGYLDEAMRTRPLLALWERKADAHRLRAASAARSGLPDPTVWAGYRIREEVENDLGAVTDEGTDFVSAGVSIPIPVNYSLRSGAARREHLAREREAVREREAAVDALRGGLEASLAAWKRAVRQAVAYGDELIPKQQATLDATLSAYRVGRADFTALFEAQVALLDLERTLVRARAETRIQRVRVQSLIGRGLSEAGGSR